MVSRIKTGIDGFDKLVKGGLPKGDAFLISGDAGTGKTVFCMQTLYNNALKGKAGLYITLEQTIDSLERQMSGFGMNSSKVKGKLKIVSLSSTDPNALDKILAEMKRKSYDFIVLDSLAALTANTKQSDKTYKMQEIMETIYPIAITDEQLIRQKILSLVDLINKSKATVFLISEIIEGEHGLSRDTYSEFLVDGVIVFHYLGVGSQKFLSMQIRKMRHSGHEKDYVLYDIADNGFTIQKEETFSP
jgi:KaiC/GvpD/RAD55 family RecA-like ATPase